MVGDNSERGELAEWRVGLPGRVTTFRGRFKEKRNGRVVSCRVVRKGKKRRLGGKGRTRSRLVARPGETKSESF